MGTTPAPAKLKTAGAVLLVSIVSLIISALPTLRGQTPLPVVHDEFAYLLQADTFAHGRLTNPPHPFWQFFETFHVIQQPTYAAKFPPGQGIALALGQMVGLPILGAWLSVAAGCAAITWMLLAIVPLPWATAGGILAATSTASYWWSQSYWGGGVAMLGGALLGGAVVRILIHHHRPTLGLGIIAGVGLAILANSRPFEGLIIALILAALILIAARRNPWMRFIAGIAVIMIPTLIWMAYYNWRVTGNALQLPYSLHAKQYMTAPLMYWEKPRPAPEYHHEVLRKFFAEEEWNEYERTTTWPGFFKATRELCGHLADVFLRPYSILMPLLIGLLMVLGNRAARYSAIVCIGFLIIHLLCTPWMRAPYLAPAMGFFYVMISVGLWRLDLFRWRDWKIGRFAAVALSIVIVTQSMRYAIPYVDSLQLPFGQQRAKLIADLKRQAGSKCLVFVHYSPEHPAYLEMVYNEADIDASDIVFAREMDEAQNKQLMAYYPNRRALLLDADTFQIKPMPQ